MTVRTIVESTLSGVSERGGAVTLDVRRTLTSQLEGRSRLSWRQAEISGEGSGTQRATIDGTRGALLELDGESTLVVRIRSGPGREAARTQQMTQKVTVTVRAAR